MAPSKRNVSPTINPTEPYHSTFDVFTAFVLHLVYSRLQSAQLGLSVLGDIIYKDTLRYFPIASGFHTDPITMFHCLFTFDVGNTNYVLTNVYRFLPCDCECIRTILLSKSVCLSLHPSVCPSNVCTVTKGK